MRSLQSLLMGKRNSFSVGDWSIEPLLDRISSGGRSVELQPQVMEVLVYLARHGGEVVSAEEITSEVWQGRVVTPSSIYVTINQLRVALGDDAKDPRYIQTVPKRGYRLTAQVRGLEEPPLHPADASLPWQRGPGLRWGSALLVILALGVTVTLLVQHANTPQEASAERHAAAPPQSVAVLPFADMSPEQDQQWFADGVSEEIINRLAQVPGLRVTGRTSSFAFRGPQTDTEGIGRALGVKHLLEGSIRTDGEQVRVTAQLLRAEDGFHVWSENFDGDNSEIFSIQDEIAADIALTLQPKLASGRGAQETGTIQSIYPRFDVYELYLKALQQINLNTRQSLLSAQDLLERALALEPDYVDAHVVLANVYGKFLLVGIFDGRPYEYYLEKATPHVERALEIDPDHAGANAALGDVLLFQVDKQREAYQRALALNPNLHRVYLNLGTSKLDELVSWREALPLMERAAEIEPLDVETALMLILFMQRVPHRWDEAEAMLERLAQAHPDRADVKEGQGLWWMMVRGRPSQAVPVFEQALLLDPDRIWVKIFLARCWYMVGEFDRARELQSQSMQWTAVFDRDREEALRTVMAPKDWDENDDFGRRMLMAYTLLMLRDFQAAVDVLAADSGDLEVFTSNYGQPLGMHNDPGMSLAVAHWSLGNQDEYEKWAEFARKAIDIRSENGRLHTFEYSMATARLNAMEGRHYDAALELEWFVEKGPLDIRELMYPAYDGMRDKPRFRELQRQQLDRVNAEREQLGLKPHPDFAALTNNVNQTEN